MARIKDSTTAHFFTLPANIVLIITTIIPILFSFYLSFFNMNLDHFQNYKFVGLYQYKRIFSGVDSQFISVIGRTIIWTVVNIGIEVVIALFLAMLLNINDLKFKGIYRTILILPWAVPAYISSLIWRGMFNYDFGIINIILKNFGLKPVEWLLNPTIAFTACIIINVWMATPFMMIVALGGLQSIDESLYEAASIDGANRWQKFTNITLPLLKPVMVPAIVLTTFVTFKQFDIIYLVTGGMQGQTDLILTYAYNTYRNFNYSLSSAYSLVIFIMLALMTIVSLKLTFNKGGKEL